MYSGQRESSVFVTWTKQVCLQTRLRWWQWWDTPDIIWNRKWKNENAWFLSAIPPKSSLHWTSFTRLSPPDTYFTAESTEAMWIKCLAQGNNILLSGFEPSTSVSKTVILANRPICFRSSRQKKQKKTSDHQLLPSCVQVYWEEAWCMSLSECCGYVMVFSAACRRHMMVQYCWGSGSANNLFCRCFLLWQEANGVILDVWLY